MDSARRVAIVLALGTAGLLPAGPAPALAPTCQGHPATIVAEPETVTLGTAGADVIVVPRQAQVVHAGGGDDRICLTEGVGSAGYVRVLAGAGNDVVTNESTSVTATGYADFPVVVLLGDGDDTFVGGEENEHVSGGDDATPDTGTDVVSTGGGMDLVASGLTSAPNRDRVDTGGGRDQLLLSGRGTPELSLEGGTSRDYIFFHSDLRVFGVYRQFPPGDVVVDNRAGTLDVGGSRWVAWSGFESLDLTELKKRRTTVIGSDAVERVFLAPKSTYEVELNGGDDYVVSVGRVLPEGRYEAGSGRDRLVLVAARGAEVDLGGSVESWSANVRHRSAIIGFEDAWVSSRSVRVRGTGVRNRIWAFFGEVVVDGLGGDDWIFVRGNDGQTVARGNRGADLLHGARSDDALVGGPGRDEARGHGGDDRCDAEVRVDCES
jgi:Ca2+-binding RTX toxin-like protein